MPIHGLRRRATLAALAALLLSGCASPTDDDAGAVPVITSPDQVLNATVANGPHQHDYWKGADRLTVLDAMQRAVFTLNGGDHSTILILPADGAVVPQGTASVETTVSWRDLQPGVYGDAELWVKTQADAQSRFVSAITSGATVTLATVQGDADLPHQSLSAWEWELHLLTPDGQPSNPATGQARSYDLEITWRADAVRGLPLPVFPAHPDFWNGTTELPLVDEAGASVFFWQNEPPGCGYCSGGLYAIDPDNGTRVPTDADFVEVTLAYRHDTPTGLRLLYHGADTRAFKDAPIASDDGATRVHLIPVDADGDGPYSAQSQWEFYFGFEDGSGPYRGAWELTARVLKDA